MPYVEIRAKTIIEGRNVVLRPSLFLPYQDKEVDKKKLAGRTTRRTVSSEYGTKYFRRGTLFFELKRAPHKAKSSGEYRKTVREYSTLPNRNQLIANLPVLIRSKYSDSYPQSAQVLFPVKKGRSEVFEVNLSPKR